MVTLNKHGYLKFIAYMQVICIILVVLGHSFHLYPDGRHGTSLLVYRMIYSFHMPAFIFVSGFLMAYSSILKPGSNAPSFGKFTVNKFKRLIIPYITLVALTFVPRVALNSFADDSFELSISQFFRAFYIPQDLIIPYLWFIQASFILLIFSYAVYSVCRFYKYSKSAFLVLITTLIILLPLTEIAAISVFSLNKALELGIFFLTGILYAFFMNRVDRIIPWSHPLLLIAFVIGWSVSFFLTENTDAFIVCQFLGICMVISLSHFLEDKNITCIDHLTGANYIIFLLSWYFNVFFQQFLSKFIVLPWWIFSILSFAAGLYGPYLIYILLKKNKDKKVIKLLSFMLGQKI